MAEGEWIDISGDGGLLKKVGVWLLACSLHVCRVELSLETHGGMSKPVGVRACGLPSLSIDRFREFVNLTQPTYGPSI